MPYLHWERVEELNLLQKATHNTGEKDSKLNRPQSHLEGNDQREPTKAEELYKMYLNIDRPLHIRRTLDQFYYRDVIDTNKRDADQTCHRYYERQLKLPREQGVSVMVDQLWLWVIPKWKDSPSLVITAFPQRANRIKDSSSRIMTALVFRIIQKCSDLPVRTGYELAEIIACECSRIFFDDQSRRDPRLKFFDIYSRSIEFIVRI